MPSVGDLSQVTLLSGGPGAAALRCPPSDACFGFTGAGADLQQQFISLPGCFVYGAPGDEAEEHDSVADYVCHAFPDDAYPTDQVFTGLIAVAVALPIRYVLLRLFEVANEADDETTGGEWMSYGGMWRLLLGRHAHAYWHFDGTNAELAPPTELTAWVTAHPEPGELEWAELVLQVLPMHLWGVLQRAVRRCVRSGSTLTVDGTGSAAAAEEDAASNKGSFEQSSQQGSGLSSARRSARTKRMFASLGFIGIYGTWAIFAWCGCIAYCVAHVRLVLTRPLFLRFIFVYGLIIHRRLGPDAEQEFSRAWGIGVGLDNVKQWTSVAQEAVKAAFIAVLLDQLRITRNGPWLESYADFVSAQALLFGGAARNVWHQVYFLVQNSRRVA